MLEPSLGRWSDMVWMVAKLLMLLHFFRCTPGSAAPLDSCVFLGEEDKNSLYENGDVVIGGLFPLHYSSVSSLPTHKAKPGPSMYK